MNTTSSTPDSYTVFGKNIEQPYGMSCVVLNRAGRYELSQVIRNLYNCGFTAVSCIEVEGDSYTSAQLCDKFDGLRIFLLHSRKYWGELVNLAVKESNSEYVMILWSDMESSLPAHQITDYAKRSNVFCMVPQLVDIYGSVIPVVHTPELRKKELSITSLPSLYQHTRTLYPTDFVGVYRRDAFLDCGGFDIEIAQPYWQLVDLGFRSGLYSKRIIVDSHWKVSYRSMSDLENRSEQTDYARFYLKNLAPNFSNSKVRIPIQSLFRLWIKKRIPMHILFYLRSRIQRWLVSNSDKIVCNTRQLLQFWQEREEESVKEKQ